MLWVLHILQQKSVKMINQNPKVLSVSQLNFYVKSLLDSNDKLNYVFLTGEISNLTDHYRSGHIYMSLKDSKSVIRAVMFAGNARNLKFKPQEGMKVICRGRVTLYEPTGQYQYYIEDMQPDGIGALAQAFEQLKTSLAEKGLFEQSHKKPVPQFPSTVGVITSPTGAALQDIRNIITRRFPQVQLVICPVLVQGSNAPSQLINAIEKLNEYNAVDTIIIGRGGGSIEDLWAFNDEKLAYAIYNSEIPVISAVGHETDFTICDFVSDLRAPTPSAAAELAVPDCMELKNYLNSQNQYIRSLIDNSFRRKYNLVENYKSRALLSSPTVYKKNQLRELNMISEKLKHAVNSNLQQQLSKLENTSVKLENLNPVSMLKNGRAVLEKNKIRVHSVDEISVGDSVRIIMQDGDITATVTETTKR